MKVTIFTRDNCAACRGTKAQFDKLGVEYTELNVQNNVVLAQKLVDDGWRSMPVVSVEYEDGSPADWWAGSNIVNVRRVAQGVRITD